MAPGIGASGIVGVAFETTPGTYVAPTKFIPITNESLKYVQDTVWRRPIRNALGILGAIPGNVHVEGSLVCEVLSDTILYFLYAAHTTQTKTGTGPYTYAFKASQAALPTKTLSITVVRNGIVFGYTGCVVSSFEISVDNGTLMLSCDILGRDEAVQSAPTATWSTNVPFGAGTYNVQIPTATQVFDADGFTFASDDSASAEYRLKNTGRGAQFVRFGENTVSLKTERDFDTRTEYDAYKALTSQTLTIVASNSAVNDQVTINMPVAVKDEYVVSGLSGQADLIRASITYNAVMDGTGNTYTITVITLTESIT